MRKSSFGQRPPRGKLRPGDRGARDFGKAPRDERGGRPDARGERDAGKGGLFRKRSRGPAGKGSRDERGNRPDMRGGRVDQRSADKGGPFRKESRGPGGKGPRDERGGRPDDRGGREGDKRGLFRQRSRGPGGKGPNDERGGRPDHRGGREGDKRGLFRQRSRGPAGKGSRDERGNRPDMRGGRVDQRSADKGGPFRKESRGPGGKGPRDERGDRADHRGARDGDKRGLFRQRSRGPQGKRNQPIVPSVSEPMRIAKAMSRAGLCSRREAERWIADGRVSLNGQVLKTPAVEVKPKDRVLVDGQPLPIAEPAQLWRYYKPKGLVTTHNDPQGRPTVFDNLPPGLPRVISVGRLDFNTEGLILLTNDGELARHLELPATGWLRRYRVRAKGRVTQADLDKLKDGVEIEGVRYGAVEAAIDTVQGANMWLTIGIREGKNREVRKVLTSLGLEVNRLIRISFGPFQLLELQPGEAETVRRRVLADQLGPQLAKEFGLVERDEAKSGKKGGGGKRQGKPEGRREDS